jgi:ubiquinone/menaquinone biosynthesis C-methylase UbiE
MASVEHLRQIPEVAAWSAAVTGPAPRFDRVARLYRAIEYLSFGPMLERCRFHHIPTLAQARPSPQKALVLGDGDGRFLARLLAANPTLHAHAVDSSPSMLRLLRTRVHRFCAHPRLTATCADARTFEPSGATYDLVCTHFFLDCLTEAEADRLVARLRRHLTPGAQWLISEFHVVSESRLRACLTRTIISALYAAFRLLTGLKVRRIPPWPALLARHGFARAATHSWLGDLLVSELWKLPQATGPQPPNSQK